MEIDQNKHSNEYWNPATNQKDDWTVDNRIHETYIAPSKMGNVEFEAPAGSSHREEVSPAEHVDVADDDVGLGTRFSNFRAGSRDIAAGAGDGFRRTSSCQC